MDDETPRNDIRKLLKTFGIRADETIMSFWARNPDLPVLHLRITLTDLTEYGNKKPDQPLHLEIEGDIRA